MVPLLLPKAAMRQHPVLRSPIGDAVNKNSAEPQAATASKFQVESPTFSPRALLKCS
jgi:hypothetical protein